MFPRKWLEDELAKNLPWDKHCWESMIPFNRHSCVGYMITAREHFNESQSLADLNVWITTVNRAEAYVKAKYQRYYAKVNGSTKIAADTVVNDDHAKTVSHMQYIQQQRELIKTGEWHVHIQAMRDHQAGYERTGNKAELQTWKSAISNAKQFLKDNKAELEKLEPHLGAYKSAEKKYNKNNSSISRCSFWCFGKAEESDGPVASQSPDAAHSQHSYVRLNNG